MTSKKMRRSGRISKSVPILLMGSDTEGRVFSEETRTVVLSFHGAGVISTHKLLAEQELILRSLETNREAEVRVVGQIGEQGQNHMYGVAFLDEFADFWQMQFPAAPPTEERPLELVLECTACGATVALLNGDYEFDVCTIHGGLVRYCTECGFATVWQRPESGVLPRAAPAKPEPKRPRVEPQVLFEEQQRAREEFALESLAESLAAQVARMAKEKPQRASESPQRDAVARPLIETPTTTTAVEDRRGRVRAKVNYFACVRSDAFGQDVVMCIDMSRGGLGFRTNKEYVISTDVTIAVPFSPESPNAPTIFVPARVVNIRRLSEQGMFRCGVMFLPAPGARAHS
jgi:hypothetical protein